MKRCGCDAKRKIHAAEHGFVCDMVRPEQREAFADILAFLEDVAGRKAE
jgi:hypothetical protein